MSLYNNTNYTEVVDVDSVSFVKPEADTNQENDVLDTTKQHGVKMWVWQKGHYTEYENIDSILVDDPRMIGEHQCVDLGLPSGLLWSTCNVGASKPEGYGDYFAWGETKTKNKYHSSNYKWGVYDGLYGLSYLTKYIAKAEYHQPADTFRTLVPEDDAATVNWGDPWRTPTHIEQMELKNGCEWKMVENFNGSGVKGALGTSKTNGNTIFLPYTGYKDGTTLTEKGTDGFYWSSSLVGLCDTTDVTEVNSIYGDTIGPSKLIGLTFNTTHYKRCTDMYHWWYTIDESIDFRCVGMTVRAVSSRYHTVNFYDVDSTLIESQTVKIYKSATPPAISGYNIGWNDSSFVCVTKDLNIYAQKNKYIVNFYSKDSVLIESQKVDTAQSASTVKAPELGGFLFTGWSDSSFVNVKGNMNTYAQYKQGVAESGKIGDYTYVDLGLPSGLKWATYNVGAAKIDDYGSYFAWGEIEPKEEFSYSTYKWCTTDTAGQLDSLLKYNLSGKGIIDSLTILEATDDAATINWGNEWRMPTYTELQELIDGCNWTWINNYNNSSDYIQGRLGTSKVNGNTIFLPTAGYYNGTKYEMFEGDYWASTINGYSNSCTIYRLNLNSAWLQLSQIHREFGLNVRAVVNEK